MREACQWTSYRWAMIPIHGPDDHVVQFHGDRWDGKVILHDIFC
jgi:hypothetical protein